MIEDRKVVASAEALASPLDSWTQDELDAWREAARIERCELGGWIRALLNLRADMVRGEWRHAIHATMGGGYVLRSRSDGNYDVRMELTPAPDRIQSVDARYVAAEFVFADNDRAIAAMCAGSHDEVDGHSIRDMHPGALVRVVAGIHDGLIVCHDHRSQVVSAAATCDVLPADQVAFWNHRCGMCGVIAVPGRSCDNERCRRPLHPQWPAVYCSSQCAQDDV